MNTIIKSKQIGRTKLVAVALAGIMAFAPISATQSENLINTAQASTCFTTSLDATQDIWPSDKGWDHSNPPVETSLTRHTEEGVNFWRIRDNNRDRGYGMVKHVPASVVSNTDWTLTARIRVLGSFYPDNNNLGVAMLFVSDGTFLRSAYSHLHTIGNVSNVITPFRYHHTAAHTMTNWSTVVIDHRANNTYQLSVDGKVVASNILPQENYHPTGQTSGSTPLILAGFATSAGIGTMDIASLQFRTKACDQPEPVPTKSVSITKSSDRSIVKPGEEFTYTIVVKNTGEVTLNDLKITDLLPSAVDAVSTSQGGQVINGTAVWTGLGLAPGAQGTLTLKVRVKDTAVNQVLTNKVTVTSAEHGVSDDYVDTGVKVEKEPAVAAATKPTPKPVPVTAQTGLGLGVATALTLIGLGSGTALTLRRYWN